MTEEDKKWTKQELIDKVFADITADENASNYERYKGMKAYITKLSNVQYFRFCEEWNEARLRFLTGKPYKYFVREKREGYKTRW